MTAAAAPWREAGLPAAALDRLHLPGQEPALQSSFKVATAAQAAIGLAGLAAAEFWRLRGGVAQDVTVDLRHAAAEARSEQLLRVDGAPPPDPWDSIAGLYPTSSGGWVRLHTNFPHHREGVLRLLGCGPSRDEVARALMQWDAFAFEAAAAEAGICVAAARSLADWDAAPQAQVLAGLDLVQITRIGPAPPRQWAPSPRPLGGVRVLDLTRVVAGPVCGRTLAAHGADVLAVSAPHLPSIPTLVTDTGRGKLSASLDLRDAAAQAALAGLLGSAAVFIQGYRPGAIAGFGFSPQDAARLHPGIVCVSLSAYGTAGPWAGRRGFDSLVQTATGLNLAEAAAFGEARPKPLPAQILDHATGHLMAFGAMAALIRQAQEGGSWLVELSLTRTALWLRSLGRMPPDPAAPEDPASYCEETNSGFGRLLAVRHAATMEQTPPSWRRPSVPLGTHPAAWP